MTSSALLLICGLAAPLLFAGTDLLAGRLWRGYSFFSRSISELSAVGAPTRSLVVPLVIVEGLLVMAFGIGAWLMGGQSWALRVTAALLVANAVFDLASQFFPMHLHPVAGASHNVAGVVLGALSMICFVLAIGFGAAAFRNWFRFLSISIVAAYMILTIVGIWVLPRTVAGQPVSRVGIQERVMAYSYRSWMFVLAAQLLGLA